MRVMTNIKRITTFEVVAIATAILITFFTNATATQGQCHLRTDRLKIIANCSSRKLTDIPVDLPDDVTTLLLGNNVISNITSGLSRLRHLEYLDLSFNSLTRLFGQPFANQKRLLLLNLEGNRLPLNATGYPPGVFNGLEQLKTLKLNKNVNDVSGMHYPVKELSKLPVLEELFMDGLPSATFELPLTSLTKLTMSSNIGFCDITNIPHDFFVNISNLHFINLTKCHIRNIDKQAFTYLHKIKVVDVSENAITHKNDYLNMLYGLQNSTLEQLFINSIYKMTDTCVKIPKTLADYLGKTKLKVLHANDNYIVKAESGTLAALPKTLEVLSLRNSRIVYGGYFLELIGMTGLKKIDISGQKVGGNMPYLQNSDSIFSLPPNLEEFYSDDSTFRVCFINKNFSKNSLKKVSYRNNVIKVWNGPMFGVDAVENIDVSENFCSKVSPRCMEGFVNLKILRANDNYLGPFLKNDVKGDVFGYSKNLVFLDLSVNRIEDLPTNIFRSQNKLEILNLSKNSISDPAFKISHMQGLELLRLRENEITELNPNFRDQMEMISLKSKLQVDLSKNPILCSCTNIEFIKWMTKQAKLFTNQDNCHCSPQSTWLVGRNVFHISDDLEIHCASRFGLGLGILASATLITSLIVTSILYRYRWKIRYLYYVARGRYRDLTRLVGDREYEYNAFVSYADEDRDFALHTFIRELEEEHGLRLCLHHRDFTPGEPIASNILSAIQKSRWVVAVLSPNFLDSYWCRWEYEMARMESLYTERNMLVLVKYQEVDVQQVPRDMLYMMHTHTYLQFPVDVEDQGNFWAALRQALTAHA